MLIADKFPNQNILYVDADVYIARALNQWDLKSSFSYRGGDSWANTAILFYHAKRDKAISLNEQLSSWTFTSAVVHVCG